MLGIAITFVAFLLSEQQQNMSTLRRIFKRGLEGTQDFFEGNHR
jgi:hypothetical protein